MPNIPVRWIRAADYKPGPVNRPIKTIILHSTCGRKLGDIETLTEEGGPVVSCHFYVTRAAEVYHFVREQDIAYHAGRVLKPEWGNSATIGIEMEHFDPDERHPNGEDWPEPQVKKVAELCAYLRGRYGNIPIVSHAAIASPKGRKQDPHNFPWDLLSVHYESASGQHWQVVRVTERSSGRVAGRG